jgi:ribonucleoside-diphosphate reductase alpha chain
MNLLERIRTFNVDWVRRGYRLGSNANNVSATVSIRDDEWQQVGEWMWENKASYNGLSVLPFDTGNYKQPPFEDLSKEQYELLEKSLRSIDLSGVFEPDDATELHAEAACAGGSCVVH